MRTEWMKNFLTTLHSIRWMHCFLFFYLMVTITTQPSFIYFLFCGQSKQFASLYYFNIKWNLLSAVAIAFPSSRMWSHLLLYILIDRMKEKNRKQDWTRWMKNERITKTINLRTKKKVKSTSYSFSLLMLL